MTFHVKTYTNGFPLNGFPLNGLSRWLPIGYPLEAFMKALKALEKPLGFFSLPVEDIEKSHWEISPKRLETLEKAVRLFSLTC